MIFLMAVQEHSGEEKAPSDTLVFVHINHNQHGKKLGASVTHVTLDQYDLSAGYSQ